MFGSNNATNTHAIKSIHHKINTMLTGKKRTIDSLQEINGEQTLARRLMVCGKYGPAFDRDKKKYTLVTIMAFQSWLLKLIQSLEFSKGMYIMKELVLRK